MESKVSEVMAREDGKGKIERGENEECLERFVLGL